MGQSQTLRIRLIATVVGCIYRSPSHPLNTNVTSLCELFTSLCDYTHLLVRGDFNFREIAWCNLSGSSNNSHIEPFLDNVDDLFYFNMFAIPLDLDKMYHQVYWTLYLPTKRIWWPTYPIYHL